MSTRGKLLSLLALTLGAGLPVRVHAEGLDRDNLLTEAPATPDRGTVRLSGGAAGEVTTPAGVEGINAISGKVLWAPLTHFAADLGLFYQGGGLGPSVRARYQLLGQQTAGVDLSVGARYKTVGFTPANGEVEALVSLGRRFGRIALVLNAVYGHESGGPGQDFELKGFAGYQVGESVRLGVDSRLQAEFVDENGAKRPQAQDMDFTAGPAVSWMITPQFQLQALAGVAKPKGTTLYGPAALAVAAFDF